VVDCYTGFARLLCLIVRHPKINGRKFEFFNFFNGGSGGIPVTERLLGIVLPSFDYDRSTRGSRDVGFIAAGKRC
jgi:hypothetical protein